LQKGDQFVEELAAIDIAILVSAARAHQQRSKVRSLLIQLGEDRLDVLLPTRKSCPNDEGAHVETGRRKHLRCAELINRQSITFEQRLEMLICFVLGTIKHYLSVCTFAHNVRITRDPMDRACDTLIGEIWRALCER
jgi:hypothetical protein